MSRVRVEHSSEIAYGGQGAEMVGSIQFGLAAVKVR